MPVCVWLVQLQATSMHVGQKLNLTKRNLIPSKYIWCSVLHAVLDCLSECDITISPLWDAAHSRYYCFLTPSDHPSLFVHTFLVLILSKRVLEFRANLRTKTDCVYIQGCR